MGTINFWKRHNPTPAREWPTDPEAIHAMPLQPNGSSVRDEGSSLSFTMVDCDRIVRCHVHRGALDSVEQTRTGDAADRLARFSRHRAKFEAVARDLHAAGLPLRITADHVTWLRRSFVEPRRAYA